MDDVLKLMYGYYCEFRDNPGVERSGELKRLVNYLTKACAIAAERSVDQRFDRAAVSSDPGSSGSCSPIRVFVSYSHQDAKYLKKDSLVGFLAGLDDEGFSFWHDEWIPGGHLWDDRIRKELEAADIALILVSQAFLNSKYCTKVEVVQSLKKRKEDGLVVFPVILSPCDWDKDRYDWLRTTQLEPRDGRTIEGNFNDPGRRKGLYLAILAQLREIGRDIRRSRQATQRGDDRGG